MQTQYILMDVEGTTSSLAFVHEELFPFATRHLTDFIAENRNDPQVQECLEAVAKTQRNEHIGGDVVQILKTFIAEDRKHPALKTLQGLVWEEGYRSGALKGHVYPDVRVCFERWRKSGVGLGIYSSGSVFAQKLLFKYSIAGDLTPYLSAHFDTRVGGKKEKISYLNICRELALDKKNVLFITDSKEEIGAATAAGIQAVHSQRPGVERFDWPFRITSFEQLDLFFNIECNCS